jgi:hypothetical protein
VLHDASSHFAVATERIARLLVPTSLS